MRTVRVLQQMSGTRNGEPWPERGQTMVVSDEEAEQLSLGQTPIAEIVEDAAEPEPEAEKEPEGDGDAKTTEPPAAKTPATRASGTRSTAAKK